MSVPPPGGSSGEDAIELTATLTSADVDAVREIVAAAAAADGVAPLNEPAMLQVTTADNPRVSHLLVRDDGRLAG